MSRPPRDDGFYVGYRRRAPAALAPFLRRTGAALLALAVATAALLAAAQRRFGPGRFEYGVERELTGVIAERPYPLLVVPRPGGLSGARLRRDAAGGAATASRYPLVGRGKHGAGALVAGLDGALVRAAGSLVYRPGVTMIELRPGAPARVPIGAGGAGRLAGATAEDLGVHTLRGEIVDSKCHLGVMKPSRGKGHRACAALCIRGGIPPMLAVAAADGGGALLLLVDEAGAPVNDRVLDRVAEPIEVTGRLRRHGDLLVLAADPAGYRRLE